MSRNSSDFIRRIHSGVAALVVTCLCLLTAASMMAQTTVGTGSIVGTITDPTGAVVSGARITVTNIGTGQVNVLTTNAAGSYNSGALPPGLTFTPKTFGMATISGSASGPALDTP